MKNPIQISIPTPCHENWDNMAPADKGRFCASCQKNVRDFTRSSDREIASAFAKETDLCGRFNDDQLNRKLFIPKQKGWFGTTMVAAVISFLVLGTQQGLAQNAGHPKREFAKPSKKRVNQVLIPRITIHGTVLDTTSSPLPGVMIHLKGTVIYHTSDIYGSFTIEAGKNDILEISCIGMATEEVIINDQTEITVTLCDDPLKILSTTGYYSQKQSIRIGGAVSCVTRTFFGRIFHAIGNVFQ